MLFVKPTGPKRHAERERYRSNYATISKRRADAPYRKSLGGVECRLVALSKALNRLDSDERASRITDPEVREGHAYLHLVRGNGSSAGHNACQDVGEQLSTWSGWIGALEPGVFGAFKRRERTYAREATVAFDL